MPDVFIDKRLLITGDTFFIKRHRLLITALKEHFSSIETLSMPHLAPSKRRFIRDIINGFPYFNFFTHKLEKSLTHWGFEYKSRILQKEIAKIKPDMVLQIFGQACSVKNGDIPFAMTLDFTLALAEKVFPKKRFSNEKNREKFINRERKAYEKAT